MECSTDKVIACAQTSEELDQFLDALPKLSYPEVPAGDFCPICLSPFSAVLEEERAGTSTSSLKTSGVTRLQCGHIFCMADIAVWVHTLRGSCPTCRDVFLIIPEPADDESSDGGEYIPGSDGITDEMMDGEAWTDEEGGFWTDGEDMSFDEGITEGETDSSWERSSEGVLADLDEEGVSAPGRLSIDPAVITNAEDGTSLMVSNANPECEQIKAELIHWRACIERIQIQEWLTNEDGLRLRINECIRALGTLKSKIDLLERDTAFIHSALATMHEIRTLIEVKLEMMHSSRSVESVQGHSPN